MSPRSRATRRDGRKERKVDLGRDAAGKRIRRSVYGKTDKEINEKARELIRAYESGTLTRPRSGTVTMADLAALFANHLNARVVAGNLSPSTRDWYLRLIDVHVIRDYGSKRVVDVTPSDVERWVTTPRLAASSPRSVYLTVRQALELAVRDGLIPRNPAEKVKAPRASSTRPDPAMEHEVDLLLKAAEGTMLTAITILSLTGMRRVELLALQWSDVDLDAGTLRIRRSKTSKGIRTLPLSKPLREHLAQLGEHHPGDYVVPNAHDATRPKDPWAFSRSFELVAKRAGIRVTSHMLRHGATTRLLHAGVPPQVISQILGHASTRELDVYAHSLPAAEATAMDVLGGD